MRACHVSKDFLLFEGEGWGEGEILESDEVSYSSSPIVASMKAYSSATS